MKNKGIDTALQVWFEDLFKRPDSFETVNPGEGEPVVEHDDSQTVGEYTIFCGDMKQVSDHEIATMQPIQGTARHISLEEDGPAIREVQFQAGLRVVIVQALAGFEGLDEDAAAAAMAAAAEAGECFEVPTEPRTEVPAEPSRRRRRPELLRRTSTGLQRLIDDD